MTQTVLALSEKYGFDAEEANRFLNTSGLKIIHKRWSASKEDKPVKPKKETGDDKTKPKRSKTGYLLYADEIREEVKLALIAELGEGEKRVRGDVVKAIGARWKEEDQEVRDEWNTKAKTPATSDDEAEAPDQLAVVAMAAMATGVALLRDQQAILDRRGKGRNQRTTTTTTTTQQQDRQQDDGGGAGKGKKKGDGTK